MKKIHITTFSGRPEIAAREAEELFDVQQLDIKQTQVNTSTNVVDGKLTLTIVVIWTRQVQ